MERFRVGIDVSAKTLDVAYRDVKRRIERQIFENETPAHAALVRHLSKRAGGNRGTFSPLAGRRT
jgi:hypothetical protein